jgi:F-type H+-transporting ATPase subunit b
MIHSGFRRINHKKMASVAVMLAIIVLVILNAGVVFASSGGGHGEEGAVHKGWIATDTYRVMNFVVLVGALFFILKKPLSQALNARIKGIKSQLEELEAKKKEAENKLVEYNNKLSRLDGEAKTIVEDYIRQGEEARARIIKEAEVAANKLEEQAQRHIEHEFKQAKKELQEEIIHKALVKAEEIIKAKITDDDQDQLVDEYLEKVVA